MDWSVAEEFHSKGITEAVITDYTSKHQHGLYVCGSLPQEFGGTD
jgi:hypothetical protein